MDKFKSTARTILANNIVYYRLKNSWSQEEFAYKLGTTSTYISNLENAKRNTRIDYIEHIANILNIELFQLFEKRETIKKQRISKRQRTDYQ